MDAKNTIEELQDKLEEQISLKESTLQAKKEASKAKATLELRLQEVEEKMEIYESELKSAKKQLEYERLIRKEDQQIFEDYKAASETELSSSKSQIAALSTEKQKFAKEVSLLFSSFFILFFFFFSSFLSFSGSFT